MSQKQIKRDALRHQRRTQELMKHGVIATVAIAQDGISGEILAVGVDHPSVVGRIPKGREGWEIKEYPLWR